MHNSAHLHVRSRAFALTVVVHKAALRESVRFGRRAPGTKSQLLRAVASISSNIVEGADQRTNAQFAEFLSHAIASASETEHHLELALELDLLVHEGPRFIAEVCEIRKMLHGLRKRVLRDAERVSRY